MARITASMVALAALTVVACDRGTDTTAPVAERQAAAAAVGQDTDPLVVSERVSSFGGMFIDAAGRPTVYLTDLADAPRARAALSRFAEEYGSSASEIQFLRAAFPYQALDNWYERTWPQVMAQAGTVFSDLDEANNRILFGVERAGIATAVNAIMRAHGVPQDAYAVEVVEPIRQLATLRDKVDPKVGGLQIHFSRYLCTLGFNVTQDGAPHFVTNSHCTATQGGVEGTVYYQPSSSSSPAIATEIKDPLYWKGGVCPKGKKCRYSDSSLARYNSGVANTLGSLAKTADRDLTISGSHNITTEAHASREPVATGATVSKVGRTTGTSTGQVTNTCVNTSVQGSQVMQLCQTFVAAAVNSGDSGSPVFAGSGNVTLVGILWGGGTNTFVFSPLRSIKDELGDFAAK